MKHPDRKRLPHDVPLWADPGKACYFITICCGRRGINQLAYDQIASDLIRDDQIPKREENLVRSACYVDARFL